MVQEYLNPFRITPSGYIGINTQVPVGILHVSSTDYNSSMICDSIGHTTYYAHTALRIKATKIEGFNDGFGSAVSFVAQDNMGSYDLGSIKVFQNGGYNHSNMVFSVINDTNSIEALTIASNGYIGIGGVIAPSEALEVNGNVVATNLIGITENDITKTGTISGSNITTLETNTTGIGYNNNLLLQTSDYTTTTIISNHIHVNLNGMTYKPLLGIRVHKDDMTTGQEVMIQVGKNHTKAISFVYKNHDTIGSSQYRLDFAGRTAYECLYGSTMTEHSIKGNLKVYGTITENASKTITHYTMYEGDLQPGFFVESTGQLFHNGEFSYENCMVTVRQATTFSNNIIGVCVEIINEEIRDCYGNVSQPAGKFCRIATHGDCLIKCVPDIYHLGDIIIPSNSGGYGMKGSSMEIIDCMTKMVPRLKITSLEIDEIDPECVIGFISIKIH